MDVITTNIYIFVMATVLALLEIQIEGANGWARNLPTWRPHAAKWYAKLYMKMMSGKEMTGYHLCMFGFVFLIFNLPFFFGFPFNIENVIKLLALFFIFIAMWDFLWFVLNLHYPLKSFAVNNVNHKQFLLGMPVDYYFSIIASLILVLIGQYIFGLGNLIGWWGENMVLFIVQTIVLILFSLYILKIDNWQTKYPIVDN